MQPHLLHDYCERTGDPSLWAEPLNAVTNLAFIFAAWRIVNLVRSLHWRDVPDMYALIFLLCGIGMGSGAWHIYPTSTTLMMDVLPITLFIYGYLAAFLRRLWGMQWRNIFIALALMLGSNIIFTDLFPPDTLYGTIFYLPTYIILSSITALGYSTHTPWAKPLLHTVFLWTCSLIMRTLDKPLCDILPHGTHFIWHMVNAWVLYRLLRILAHTKITQL